MTVEHAPLVKINAPEFYKDQAFINFLNYAVNHPHECALATWHVGGKPNEYSDLFVTYDNGDGSHAPVDGREGLDSDLIPSHIWKQICAQMEKEGVSHALLWITNLEA